METCARHKIERNVKIIENISMDGEYVFNWNNIQGEEIALLKKFLIENFYINWIEDAVFKKSDLDNTITASTEPNSLLLKLDDKKKIASLSIDGVATYEFMANDKLDIYDEKLDYLTKVLNELETKKEEYHHYSPLALLDRSHAIDAQNPQTIVIDLRGIENHVPITHSISVTTKNRDGGYIYIKPGCRWSIDKDLIEEMIPCSSYRYLIWARVENEDKSIPTPENPATSSLIIYNLLVDYITGDSIEPPQKDCKSIKVKSEYKGVEFMQYISDQRPFRNGFPVYIRNEGKNTIHIKRIGFIYII